MDETTLLTTLRKMNSWWDSGSVPKELDKDYKRLKFSGILELLDLERMILVIGARRVGKTVLIHQIISHLIRKVEAKNVLYVQLDHPNLKNLGIEELMDVYKKYLRPDGRLYIFLDEIQYVADWPLWLKSFYERKGDVKFVLSGSAASSLKKGSESLLGRITEVELYPFSFYEFANFRGTPPDSLGKLRGAGFMNAPKIDMNRYLKLKGLFEPLFNEYIVKGGFPETFGVGNTDLSQKLLRDDVINKAVYRDIVKVYDIKEPEVLESLFTYICFNSSRILNKDETSGELGVTRVSLSNYLSYLKSAFLAYDARNYAGSIKKSIRTMRRFYACDSGLINSITMSGDELFTDENKLGMLIETLVFNHCLIYVRENNGAAFYWRDKQKNEVDVVLKLKNRIIPIEVKYRSRIRKRDIKGLLRFMKKFGVGEGMVLTKDLLKKEENITYMPAWLFLLLI